MKIKVIGRKYSETATYYDWDRYKEFPKYEKPLKKLGTLKPTALELVRDGLLKTIRICTWVLT